MTLRSFYFLCGWLDRLAKIGETEQKVQAIKQNTVNQIDAATKAVNRAGELQTLAMKKTTTYYIAKAVGGIQ